MEILKIHNYLEIPQEGAMLVPARVYPSAYMIGELCDDPAFTQVADVARLPGICSLMGLRGNSRCRV
jgi:hypothetical protein